MRTKYFARYFSLQAGAALALAGCLAVPAANAAWAQDAATPPPQQSARTDADIQSDVANALTRDATLQGQHVTASADHGIVTLNGNVQTEQQRQAAETAAANVQGVSGIQNNIAVAGQAAGSQSPSPEDGQPPLSADDQQAPPPPDEAEPQPTQSSEPQQPMATGPAAGNPPPPPPPDQSEAPRPAYPSQRGYGQQPYGQPGYGQPSYGNYPPPQQVSGPVTIPAGTLLQVRTAQPLDLSKLQDGATVEFTAASDVFEGNVLAIPRGATMDGTVVAVKKPGSLGGNGELQLQVNSVTLGGRQYPLGTDIWSSKTPNKAGYTARNTAGGAILGAIIGGIAGGGPAAAAGAIVGGGAGMAASAATNPRNILPPEMLLNFHLTNAATVQPVSWQEAQRLAQNAAPQLQRRRVYVVRPYPYPYGYPYPYPYPYYRAYGW